MENKKSPLTGHELITDYQTSTDTLPNVDIYYNPSENYSRDAYYNILGALEYHATEIGIERFGDSYNPFTVNIGFDDNQNQIFDEEKASGQMFAGMLPMLIIMFLFSAAMSIGPDSIAGEKERGTIATLLVFKIFLRFFVRLNSLPSRLIVLYDISVIPLK